MVRLRRYEAHRYVGTRDDMVFYDCDDSEQLAVLEERSTRDRLADLNLLQAFGPDTAAEARNRGFSSYSP